MRSPDRLAQLLSGLLHPVFLSSFVFGAVIPRLPAPTRSKTAWWLVSALFSTLLPLLLVLILRLGGAISSLRIPERRERFYPLLLGMACYGTGTLALKLSGAPLPVTAVMLCYTDCAAASALLTLRWKISLHALGVWASLTALYVLAGDRALLLGPLALAVSWARIRLAAHTPAEVCAGGCLGALITYFQMRYLV
jgi:membrane-associated phospholipid phosphatase